MLIAKEDSFVLDKEPESKIIGKFVILVPFSNLNMEVYVTKEERLTPLNDAVLRIYAMENQNFNIEETSEILGVSISDVENSYYRLLEKDLIDFVTKRITDDSRELDYLVKIIKDRFKSIGEVEVYPRLNMFDYEIMVIGKKKYLRQVFKDIL